MTAIADPPGARILWRLRRRTSDVSCVLHPLGSAVEVRVLQETDVVIREMFPAEAFALQWADAYSERLRAQGWTVCASSRSPSSAA